MNRAWLFFLAAAALAAPPTVIQNGTVMTVTKGTIKDGSILIRDGKIAEVGQKVMVPPGAQIIDAGGQFVMPGIIDCHSHIAAESINEGSVSVSSMVGIEDVLNPEDISIYRALAGGVTTVNVLHGGANAIGGKCTVIKTRWGKDVRGLIFDSHYDAYKGVVAYLRLAEGTLRPHDVVRLIGSGAESELLELGVFRPQQVPVERLSAGEVGYVATGLKSVRDCQVGDTLTTADRPAAAPLRPRLQRRSPLRPRSSAAASGAAR